MEGDMIETMCSAVKNAGAFLMCYSKEYETSPYCKYANY